MARDEKHAHSAGGDGGGELQPTKQLDLPTYGSDGDAPEGCLFWHTGESAAKYKDSGGTVRGVTSDSRVAVSEDGAEIVANPTDINFGPGAAASDDGDGTVTVSVPSRTFATEGPNSFTNSGNDPTGQDSVSFANAYDPDAVHIGVGAHHTTDSDTELAASLASYNTDASGNVTGANIDYFDPGGAQFDIRWWVFGVVA